MLTLTLTVVACSSSGQGGGTGGNGQGGTGAGMGGQGQGGAVALAPVTLHITWSTWQLSGTTMTAVTCPMLGVDTVGFQFDGATLDTQENDYTTNGTDCGAGEMDYDWPWGAGNFSVLVGLWQGSFDANSTPALVAVRVSFTVPPTGGTVVLPEAKMVFARLPLAWTIEKGGATASCADAGAQTVQFLLVEGAGSFVDTDISFSHACADTSDTTPPLLPGSYTATATLVGTTGTTLATWSTPSAVVVTGDTAPPLPPITFTIP